MKKVQECGDQMIKHVLYLLLALTTLVHAQDQSGFISIDCGISDNSSYIDATTGIFYVSDTEYTDTGVSETVSPQYITNNLEQQFSNVRSFPQGFRNCYSLKVPQANGQTKYLIRARFMYGNYDAKNQVPKFDLHLGVDYWDTVILLSDRSKVLDLELIHVFSTYYAHVCLINTGQGTPFISALELRPVDKTTYETDFGSLALTRRYDMRSYSADDYVSIRYKDDIFDRIWEPSFSSAWSELSTSMTIGPEHQNNFKVPSSVMRTAVTPQASNGSLDVSWSPAVDPDTRYFMYMHFTELQPNQFREFNIYLDDKIISYEPIRLAYLTTDTFRNSIPLVRTKLILKLNKTESSTLPPVLNGIELYTVKNLASLLTYQGDVDAINSVKSEYRVKRNWQGDPCNPGAYFWEGLKCIRDKSEPPRIISLSLPLSGLTGKICSSIVDLKMLQYLDLSNNNLTGDVPYFLTQMQTLTVLNLKGNNLTGTVPAELIERSKRGSLSLSIEGNPNLCMLESCEMIKSKKKKKSIVVPIVASVAAVAIISIAFAILWMFILKRREPQQQQQVASVTTEAPNESNRINPIRSRQQQYTYSELKMITSDFGRVLGKGGFGTVYHGYLEETEVAVKMLSPSSGQGYKEFKAEAELLMSLNHKNVTSLVGYCDDDNNMGLIYEYMAKGDLISNLSGRNTEVLSWKSRLGIAIDAAKGLEYLHIGCTPRIIHRDVKSTNILLTDEFHAKLGDFGLSRVFPTGKTHVSTQPAGTPGYADPESNVNEKSDIFSFGVVLLEIITGKPPLSTTKIHIKEWVNRKLEIKGNVEEVVDPRLEIFFNPDSVWKVLVLAMLCVSTTDKRPTMSHVVAELESYLMKEEKNSNQIGSEKDLGKTNSLNINTTGLNPRAR